MRELSTLGQQLWPLVVAHAFQKNLDEKSVRKLLGSDSYQQLLMRPGAKVQAKKILSLAEVVSIKTIKQAERFLEQSLTEDVKKSDGAVYTPTYIVNFILNDCLKALGNHELRKATVLDPACGSGGFLVGALEQISNRTGENFHEVSKRLYGLDKNTEAVQNARLLLDLACMQSSGELSQARVETCDTLLTPVREQLALIGQESGVSVLATNPPYVKLQTLSASYRTQLVRRFPVTASGAFSLASLFIANATSYLCEGGVAGFITLNNVFTSLAGKTLREQWATSREVRKIIDFRHFPVFEASAYTCLIFLDRKRRSSLEFSSVNRPPSVESLDELKFEKVSYANLRPEKWRLATKRNLDLVTRLELYGIKLRDAAEIKVGLATLFDKGFICHLKDGSYFAIGGDGMEREIEFGIVEKFTKISELSESTHVSAVQRGIIYPYSKATTSRALITWKQMESDFPLASEHLLSWRPRLLKRSGINPDVWYEWGRRQGLISEPGKLLTKTFDKKPNFYLDNSDGLFANGYSVRPIDMLGGYNIHQLKAFLESRFMHAYALVTSFEIEGGYQCYQKNFIENICLPPAHLLPEEAGERIYADSSIEHEIAEFYGFTVRDLDSCLEFYLN